MAIYLVWIRDKFIKLFFHRKLTEREGSEQFTDLLYKAACFVKY